MQYSGMQGYVRVVAVLVYSRQDSFSGWQTCVLLTPHAGNSKRLRSPHTRHGSGCLSSNAEHRTNVPTHAVRLSTALLRRTKTRMGALHKAHCRAACEAQTASSLLLRFLVFQAPVIIDLCACVVESKVLLTQVCKHAVQPVSDSASGPSVAHTGAN